MPPTRHLLSQTGKFLALSTASFSFAWLPGLTPTLAQTTTICDSSGCRSVNTGVHRVIVTGTTKLELWDAGYLDVGRTNIVRLAFSRRGRVEVYNDPYAWLPDENLDLLEVWRR